MDEIVLTLSPATHDVVKVEKLGKAGQRTELSEQECAELASGDESSESGEPDPSASYLRRESVELGFIAVLQYLPGKQRDLMMGDGSSRRCMRCATLRWATSARLHGCWHGRAQW
jgi:hypothetical protein